MFDVNQTTRHNAIVTRRLLFAALLGLSLWTIGGAHASVVPNEGGTVAPAAASCAVTSPDSTDARQERWNAAPQAAPLGGSVWRAQPPHAQMPALAAAAIHAATTLVVTVQPRSHSGPPHLHDTPLLI